MRSNPMGVPMSPHNFISLYCFVPLFNRMQDEGAAARPPWDRDSSEDEFFDEFDEQPRRRRQQQQQQQQQQQEECDDQQQQEEWEEELETDDEEPVIILPTATERKSPKQRPLSFFFPRATSVTLMGSFGGRSNNVAISNGQGSRATATTSATAAACKE
jgi:hypothetical protein